jgi:hypothetical protein
MDALTTTAGQQAALAPVATPDPLQQLITAAVQRGAPLDELREITQLARELREDKLREQKRLAELAFRRDYAAFKGLNIIIPKTKKVEQRSRSGGAGPTYWQAEFDVVCDRLSEPLSRFGFGYRHDPKFITREWPTAENPHQIIPWVVVTCYLDHVEGHTETVTLEGPNDDSGAKNPLQEMQSTATYLKRQSLLAITGTATGGEDNDGRGTRGSRMDDEKDASPSEALIVAGHIASGKGSEALTAWWGGLDAKQRAVLNKEFAAMRREARKADEALHG